MKIKVNGKERSVEQNISITDLLKLEKVENPEAVSVQLNGEFVEQAKFGEAYLKDGDMVDFLYFMGGGK